MAWSKVYGPWGCRVTVRELPDGWMQGDIRVTGYPRKRIRLRHRDREAAKRWAKATQADLQRGITRILESQPAIDRIFGLYLRYQTPKKRSPSSRQHDGRCAELWQRILGSDKTPDGITTREWEEFVVARRSGAIDPRGKFVADKHRHKVKDRAIERDMDWLVQVFNWAVKFRDDSSRYLMSENPLRGFDIPSELNPMRSIVTRDWMEKVVKAAGPTPLRAMLVIADEHGRRLSAIRQLQGSDIRLGRTEAWPHGAIRWRHQSDKARKDWLVPMSARLRREIDRHLAANPVLGDAPLFPAPQNHRKSVSKDRAGVWLLAAIKRAGVQKPDGTLWHAIRRLWITEHKEMPLRERMYVAGYLDRQTMEMVYEHIDPFLLQETVETRREYREAR